MLRCIGLIYNVKVLLLNIKNCTKKVLVSTESTLGYNTVLAEEFNEKKKIKQI